MTCVEHLAFVASVFYTHSVRGDHAAVCRFFLWPILQLTTRGGSLKWLFSLWACIILPFCTDMDLNHKWGVGVGGWGVVFYLFKQSSSSSSLTQACCQTVCLRWPGWHASSPTSRPCCSTCTCRSHACVKPGRTSSCRWTFGSPSLFRWAVVIRDLSQLKWEASRWTQLISPLCRRRTQALKFKMSFWSSCCGDSRGEKTGNDFGLVHDTVLWHFSHHWLFAVIQPWTAGSSHEPADRQGESKRCKSSPRCSNMTLYARQIHIQRINMLSFIFTSGPEEAWPVHRVLLLQHPEAGDQPPAEVFSAFHFSSTLLPVTWCVNTCSMSAAALKLCCITSAKWKECPCGNRSLSPSGWIQQP